MKNLLLLFLMLATFSVSAQEVQVRVEGPIKAVEGKGPNERLFDGTESLEGHPVRKSIHQIYAEQGAQTNGLNREEWIGATYYDLQTNGCGQNRVQADDVLNIRTVWTHHAQTEDGAFPTRGTGFTETVDTIAFLQDDGATLEAQTSGARTGWPNLVTLEDGTDVVVNHLPAAVNDLVMLRRAPGATNWTESRIPTIVPTGLLWPQIVAVGNTIHLICVSTPAGNDGAAYEGLDPALLYFRSLDGGLTWDIADRQLPGLVAPSPTTTFDLNIGINGDSYQLVADENDNVAIGIFDSNEDVLLLKSSDGGDSWTNTTILAFPFEDYTGPLIYTIDDIGGIDPEGPGRNLVEPIDPLDPDAVAASLAFLACDGTGSLAFDSEGNVHVVFAQTYLTAADTTQAGASFYPTSGNMIYWNECMDTIQRLNMTVNALDTNGDTLLGFANERLTNNNMILTYPSLEILPDDRMVLAYVGAMEELIRDEPTNENPLQHYSHIWMIASGDFGATWTEPLDIINPELSLFEFLVNTTDALFPNMDVISDDQVAITYQFDDEPGLNLTVAEMDPVTSNTITMMTLNVEEVLGVATGPSVLGCLVGTTTTSPETFKFEVTPNPAVGSTIVNFELDQREDVTIDLYNVVGSLVGTTDLGTVTGGSYSQNINLDNLSSGVYMVSLRAGDKVATQKLVVTK